MWMFLYLRCLQVNFNRSWVENLSLCIDMLITLLNYEWNNEFVIQTKLIFSFDYLFHLKSYQFSTLALEFDASATWINVNYRMVCKNISSIAFTLSNLTKFGRYLPCWVNFSWRKDSVSIRNVSSCRGPLSSNEKAGNLKCSTCEYVKFNLRNITFYV